MVVVAVPVIVLAVSAVTIISAAITAAWVGHSPYQPTTTEAGPLDDPYSIPKPLHATLSLDSSKEPFYPQSLSSSPNKQWHQRVRMAVMEATAKEVGSDLGKMEDRFPAQFAEPHLTDGIEPGEAWALTLMEIGSLLANDDVRGHYAQWFVPRLTKNNPKDAEQRKAGRVEALKELCA
ncbi:hypothetical protein ACHAPT_013052 [Fusarium lateritium]